MNRNENESKSGRLFGVIIFILMLFSFILHLCSFGEIIFRNINISKNELTNEKNSIDLFDKNILPIFCIFTDIIWTIVPFIVLDQCCTSNKKNLKKILLKLFLCTCPLLLCNELSLIVVCQNYFSSGAFLIIIIKWLIFISTILICFWNGILNDETKRRGIYGGRIVPELHLPLYRFEN